MDLEGLMMAGKLTLLVIGKDVLRIDGEVWISTFVCICLIDVGVENQAGFRETVSEEKNSSSFVVGF